MSYYYFTAGQSQCCGADINPCTQAEFDAAMTNQQENLATELAALHTAGYTELFSNIVVCGGIGVLSQAPGPFLLTILPIVPSPAIPGFNQPAQKSDTLFTQAELEACTDLGTQCNAAVNNNYYIVAYYVVQFPATPVPPPPNPPYPQNINNIGQPVQLGYRRSNLNYPMYACERRIRQGR